MRPMIAASIGVDLRRPAELPQGDDHGAFEQSAFQEGSEIPVEHRTHDVPIRGYRAERLPSVDVPVDSIEYRGPSRQAKQPLRLRMRGLRVMDRADDRILVRMPCHARKNLRNLHSGDVDRKS